jgi:hypothetical protein
VKKFFIVFLTAAAFILFQFSCTKIDTTTLGTDLIPAVDNINTFDTTLEVTTDLFEFPDSTVLSSAANHALGIVNDGLFGTTNAGIYFVIVPSNGFINHPFGFNAKDSVRDQDIDSVVLQLAYQAVYGDSTASVNIQVEEINTGNPNKFRDSFSGYPISTLKSFFGTGNTILGSITQNYQELNDTRKIVNKVSDTASISNVMRIRLDRNLGVRLKNYDSTAATNFAYKSDSFFRAQFQGLGIVATGNQPLNQGALAYFNLRDPNTKLIVYYKYKKALNPTQQDTLQSNFTLAINSFAAANPIARTKQFSYANTIANGNANDPELYLQSSPGSFALVKIPGLKDLSNRTIHRAELIIERVPGGDQNSFDNDYPFDTPPLLFLDAIDSTNNNRPTGIPNDFQPALNTALGYDLLSFGGDENTKKGYRFNLSRYVQGIVTRKEKSYALRLFAPYNSRPYYLASSASLSGFLTISTSSLVGYGRVVVAGGSFPDPAKKMRLRIIYSKI